MEINVSTKLAYDRTRLAYENTLMSWVRTATALITFGFSVHKFFEFEMRGAEPVGSMITPRGFSLMMITFGLVSLALGTIQHVVSSRQLRTQCPGMPRSVAAVLAGLISLIGILTLVAVLFRQ
jgi:putative membrane protein